MKKFLVLLVTGLLVFCLAGSALASTGNVTPATGAAAVQVQHYKIKDLQGYDQLLQLRADAKTMLEQIKADRDQLKTLVQAARQAKNKAALQALKPDRDTLKQACADLKTLCVTQNGNWQAMKSAYQANDQQQMQTIMDQILSIRQQKNDKLNMIKSTLEQMIQSLQSAPPAPSV